MRFLITSLVSASIVLVGCSSKDDGSPPSQPSSSQDSGSAAPVGTTTPPPPTNIPLTIHGSGRVVTKDSKVDCVSDGTTQSGDCTITVPGVTLYATHGYNWSFDHWEPSMTEDVTLFIPLRDGPTTLTAVFRDLAPGTPPPKDAGTGD